MAVALKDMVAVQNEQVEGIIGDLFWYGLGEQQVSRLELEDKLALAGLDTGWLPNEIRPSDAFRRATKAVEQRKPSDTPGVARNFLVREVSSDREVIQRNIVCEIVDEKGKRLEYITDAGIMKLDKVNGNTFSYTATSAEVEMMCEEAKELYNIFSSHYPSQALRSMVTRILWSCSPTPVRPAGGVYFVPENRSETIRKLCTFLNSLEKGEGFKVPLVNSLENRKMVSGKLFEHMDNILENVRSVLTVGIGVKKSDAKAILEDAQRILKDYQGYQSIIADESERYANYVDLLQFATIELLDKIED